MAAADTPPSRNCRSVVCQMALDDGRGFVCLWPRGYEIRDGVQNSCRLIRQDLHRSNQQHVIRDIIMSVSSHQRNRIASLLQYLRIKSLRCSSVVLLQSAVMRCAVDHKKERKHAMAIIARSYKVSFDMYRLPEAISPFQDIIYPLLQLSVAGWNTDRENYLVSPLRPVSLQGARG